ncbi:MAG: hypothetical protein JWO02_3401 [Solirubrobacterales bacterium]|nr:hypothetical protein [Solirubrobacterales bacterium]
MFDRLTALVDRAWPQAAIACLALALVITVVAYATQPARQDDDRVRNVLTDFVNAAADRDAGTACSLLTAKGKQAVTAAVPGTPCDVYARSFGFDVAGLGGVTLRLDRKLPDRVVLDSTNMIAPDGAPVQRRVELVRVGGDFRIDALTR